MLVFIAALALLASSPIPPSESGVAARLQKEASILGVRSISESEVVLYVGGVDGDLHEGDSPQDLPPSLIAIWSPGSQAAEVVEMKRGSPAPLDGTSPIRGLTPLHAGLLYPLGEKDVPLVGVWSEGLRYCDRRGGTCRTIVPHDPTLGETTWKPVNPDRMRSRADWAFVARSGQNERAVTIDRSTGSVSKGRVFDSYDAFGRPWGTYCRFRDKGVLAISGYVSRVPDGLAFSYLWLAGPREGQTGEVALRARPSR